MDFSHNHQENPTKNLTGLTVVVLFHILLAWVLLTNTGKALRNKILPPPETKIIEAPKLPPPPPPKEIEPPKPVIPPKEVWIPPPEVNIQTEAPKESIQVKTAVAPDGNKALVIAKVDAPKVVTQAVVDSSASCAQPEYPSSSVRNEEEGTVTVAFMVGLDGGITESKIEKSSGFPALDKATRAAYSLCKFKPAVGSDGKPIASWAKIKYVWKLE
jgi:protein TonB